MRIISGFFVYKAYVTYKAHFNQKGSDISKYNFNIFNISYETFLNTKGHHYYDNIAKKIQKESDIINLLISAFLDEPSVWIGDIWLNIHHYIDLKEVRENRIANMAYVFRRDCIYLLDSGMIFDDGLGEFVLDIFLQSNIELETFIIFRKIFEFNLDKVINYNYLYKGKYEKYEFLLNINKEKYKLILQEAIMNFRD